MDFLNTWWGGLEPLARWFFSVAIFFSVFFLWQLVMALVGLTGGDGTIDSHVESTDAHHSPDDSDASMAAFKLLSFRSILAFLTLFFWSGALGLQRQASLRRAMAIALLWGLVAMFAVALLLYLMKRLTETGNLRVDSCVGARGTVYLDIPGGGTGEIRALCGGVMTHLKARTTVPGGLKSGAAVRIVKQVGPETVEVEDASSPAKCGEKVVAS